MQRVRGGGNAARAIACLPALVGAWRDRAGGLLLSSSGHFPVDRAALQRPDLLAGRRPRTINMSTIGDALLRHRPASAGEGHRGLQQQPGRGGARVGQGGARASRAKTCSPWCWSSSAPTPPTTPTTCCPPPRSWSTGTSTAATATPTCC
jgi:anaerobic selenocysteine-containing dehydrogenase